MLAQSSTRNQYRKWFMNVAIVALMLISSFVLLAPTVQAAEDYNPDVYMDNDSASKSVSPGNSVKFNLIVENRGVNEDTITINVTIPQQFTDAGWIITKSVTEVTLPDITQPDNTQSFYVEIFAPSDAVVPTIVTITVKAISGNSSSIFDTQTLEATVTQTYGVELTTPTSQQVLPGKQITYSIKVANKGNGQDTIALEITSKPSGWQASLSSPSVTLDAKKNTSVTLTVRPPSTERTINGIINIKGTSEGNSNKTQEIFITTEVQQVYGVSLTVQDNIKYVNKGGVANYQITLKNTGNGQDSFLLEVSNPHSGDGWQGQLSTYNIPDLAANATTMISFTVIAPVDVDYNDFATIQINASSTGNASKKSFAITTTYINQAFGVSVSCAQNTKNADIGTTGVDFALQIKNTGNGIDTFNLASTKPGAEWGINLPSSVTLNGDETGNVTLSVTNIPSTALSTGYNLEVTAVSQGNANVTATYTVTVIVNQIYNIKVSAIGGSSRTGFPGDTLEYTLQIENLGNGEDTIDMSYPVDLPSDWTTYFSRNSVTLDAKSKTNITYTVELQATAAKTTRQIRIVGTTDVGTPTNQSDDKNATVLLSIQVKQVYGVKVSSVAHSKNALPGATVTYNITVRNTGTGEDTVLLSYEGEAYSGGNTSTWASLDTDFVTLGAKNSTVVTLTLSVPTNVDLGTYPLSVIGTSQEDDTKTSMQLIQTIISPVYGVLVTANPSTAHIRLERNYTYNVLINNIGNQVDDYAINISMGGDYGGNVEVSIPDGMSILRDVQPDSYETLPVTIKIYKDLGAVEVDIEARSIEDASETSTLTLTTMTKTEYNAVLAPVSDTEAAAPGGTVQYTINLTNTGTTIDQFTLKKAGTYKAWVQSITPPALTLQPGEGNASDFVVSVKVPLSALLQTYEISIEVESQGAKDAGETAVVDTVALTVDVTAPQADLTRNPSFIETEPNTDAIFTIQVRNRGDSADTYTLDIVYDYYNWASVAFDNTPFTLQPDAIQTIQINVSVKDDTLMGQYVLTVELSSRSNGDLVLRNSTLIVNVEQIYGVEMSTFSNTKNVKPGETATYTIDIENTGNGPDQFIANIYSTNATYITWSDVDQDGFIELGAGENMNVNLTVTPPSNTKVTNIIVALNVSSRDDPTGTAKDSLTTQTVVSQQTYDVYLEALTTTKTVDPNSTVVFMIDIENAGDGTDTFIIEANASNAQYNSRVTPSVTTVMLDEGATGSFDVTVTIPYNAQPEELHIFVTATSRGADNDVTDTVDLTIVINPIYDLELSGTNLAKEIRPGQSSTYIVDITNTGTDDDRFKVAIVPGASAGWVRTYTNSTSSLVPNDVSFATITVEVPEDQSIGEYTIKIKVSSLTDTAVFKQIDLIVNVLARRNLTLSSTDSVKEVDPGDSVVYEVIIQNIGTDEDTFDIALDSPNATVENWAVPSLTFVTLGPDESVVMNVTVTVDDVKQEPLNGEITVNVSARGDDEIRATLDLIVIVKPVYNVTLSSPDLTKDVAPGESVNYKIKVKNAGTIDDRFDVEVVAGLYSSWVESFNATTNMIPAGAAEWIWVEIVPPNSTEVGDYTIEIKVTSNGDEAASQTIGTITHVLPRREVEISVARAVQDVEPGESVTFTLNIHNTGTGQDTFDIDITLGGGLSSRYLGFASTAVDFVIIAADATTDVSIDVDIPTGEEPVDIVYNLEVTSRNEADATDTTQITAVVEPKYAVELSSFDLNEETDPGQAVTYIIKVKNTGTTNDFFEITPVTGTYSNWVTDILSADGTSTTPTISAGQTTQVTVEITPPEDTTIGTYSVTFEATSQNDNDVTDTIVTNTYVNPKREVELSATIDLKKALPDESVQYEVVVRNTGTGQDTFDLEVLSTNNTWLTWVTLDRNFVTINTDATASVFVTVDIPAAEPPKDVVFTLRATSQDVDTAMANQTLTLIVKPLYDLALSSSDTTKDVDPESSIDYKIKVVNEGTVRDRFVLDIVSGTYSHWVSDYTNSTTQLAPGDFAFVNVTITAPEEADVGDYPITIEISSMGDPDVKDTIATTTHVLPLREVELETAESNKDITPHTTGTKATVQYSITIRNTGTAQDTFEIEVDETLSNHEDWVTLSRSTTDSIPAGSSTMITVTITIPNRQAAETFYTTIKVTSEGNDLKVSTLQLTTNILQIYDVEITGGSGVTGSVESEGLPGQDVAYTLYVENKGTTVDTIRMEVQRPSSGTDYSSWAQIDSDDRTFSIAAGQTRAVVVTVSIPEDEAVGERKITIAAISQEDEAISANPAEDSIDLRTSVEQMYNVTFVRAGVDTTIDADPATNGVTVLDFDLKVRNRGNDYDTVSFYYESTDDVWQTVSITPESVELGPKDSGIEETTIAVKLTSKSDVRSGTYTVTIRSLSENNDEQGTIDLHATINQDTDLELKTADDVTSQDGLPGETLTYRLQVKNKGNYDETFTIIPTGTTAKWISDIPESIQVNKDATGTMLIDVSIPSKTAVSDLEDISAGSYTITVKVASQQDETIYKTMDLTVQIEEDYGVTIEMANDLDADDNGVIDESAVEEYAIGDTSSIAFDIYITNTGNLVDSIKLSLKDISSDISPRFSGQSSSTPKTFTNIQPGDKLPTTVSVPITSSMDPGLYSFEVHGTAGDQLTDAEPFLTFKFRLITYDLTIDSVTLSKEDPAVGDVISISAVIRNRAGVEAEDMVIIFEDNDEEIGRVTKTIKGNDSVTVTLSDYKISGAGAHDIEVSIEGEDDATTGGISFQPAAESILDQYMWYIIGALVGVIFIVGIGAWIASARRKDRQIQDEIALAKRQAREEAGVPPGSSKMPAALRGGPKDEGAPGDDEGEEEEPPKGGKPVQIKCPKCGTVHTVTSTERPLEVRCSECSTKLLLKA